MPTPQETDEVYMGVALLHARLSKGKRLKVGACLVLESGVIIGATNGLPTQLGNDLEEFDPITGELVTKREVIHAEQQCLNKACLEGVSTKGAKMYINYSCCAHCASNMIACGVSEVIYLKDYRESHGLDLLKKANIITRKLKGEYG